MLSKILGSQCRTAILKILFTPDHLSYHLRELARRAHLSAPVLQREVNNLVGIGLLHKTKDGSRMYYQANESSPLYLTLCELVHKTDDLAEKLGSVLVDDQIDCSFIFGSHATNSATAQSDIDLFLIGNIGLREVINRIHEAFPDINREINPYVISRSEFVARRNEHDHFISQVMKSNKIFLKGDDNELRAMEV
jgi:predicted nucleotidyltransferase/predicted transcriptional regulator